MNIKTIIKILRETKYIRSVLKKYGDSLVCGIYYQHKSFRALSLDEPEIRERARIYFDKGGSGKRMQSVAKALNKIHFFKNKNKRSSEEYEGFYSANNYDKIREIKLFSFKRNKILTICTSPDEMQKQIDQYKIFGSAYNMPSVKKNNKYGNSFEISMIDLKKYIGERFAFENIIRSTIAYNPCPKELILTSVKDLTAFSCKNEEQRFYMTKLVEKIDPSLMDMTIPSCIQHGDLSKDNLLYGECDGKVDFWWIDWEHAGNRVFFYDLFFYMVNSALFGDSVALNHYVNGDIDKEMSDYFSHFGLVYDKKYRFDYLLIFMIPFLVERVCPNATTTALKQYYEIIEIIGVCKEGEKNEA